MVPLPHTHHHHHHHTTRAKRTRKHQEQIKRLPARTHRKNMKVRREPVAAGIGSVARTRKAADGRAGKRAEAARASMARATGGSRSGGTQAVGGGERRRPSGAPVGPRSFLSPLFYRALGGLEARSRGGVVYIAKIYTPLQKSKGRAGLSKAST